MEEPFPIPQHTLRWIFVNLSGESRCPSVQGLPTCVDAFLKMFLINQFIPLEYQVVKETTGGIPLVVQWVRIHLPVQAPWAWKDSTLAEQLSPGATTAEPVHPSAQTPQPLGPVLGLLKPVLRRKRSQDSEKAAKSGPCSPQLEKPHAKQQRPSTARNQSVKMLEEAMG